MVADHSPLTFVLDPHRDVARRVIEWLAGVRAPGLPASGNDGCVPVDTDVVFVAVCLFPPALSGPEGGEDLLFAHDTSPVVDLRVIRRHETVESVDIEPQVGEEPLALGPQDSLDSGQNRRPTSPKANLSAPRG
jgi:hypothetical protein